MAIKILKHGEKIFKATCEVCGCEFTYTADDLQEDTFKNHFIECPDCKEPISHIYEAKNKHFRLLEDGLFTVNEPHTPVHERLDDDMANPWAVFQLDNCDKCPYYKRILDGDYVGDSPCNWCQKRQVYCTNHIDSGSVCASSAVEGMHITTPFVVDDAK